MKNRRLLALSCAALALALGQSRARADVTLLDQNGWKFMVGGFAELDAIVDTTRGLSEVVGNSAVPIAGAPKGDNGRTAMSMRNSRLSFTALAPASGDWKTKGYIESDFLGFDPANDQTAIPNSEASYFTNPTFRLRHAYVSAESDSWTLLAGQYWTLFGWQPSYFLATVEVAPVSGTMYQRTPQVLVVKNIGLGETGMIQAGLAIDRPAQRDSMLPNLTVGLRWADKGRMSGLAGGTSGVKNQPMSVGLSGTIRQFVTPSNPPAPTSDNVHYMGSAGAVDVLLPILAASDEKSAVGTLTFSGEATLGQGYGDEFPSWSGGLKNPLNTGTGSYANTNLDAGQGGYDATGAFQMIHLQTFDFQLQYHLPGDLRTFATAGYGQLYSNNVGQLVGATYERTESVFVNAMHDCTDQIRVGLEVAQHITHYVSGDVPHDDRAQFSVWYRF